MARCALPSMGSRVSSPISSVLLRYYGALRLPAIHPVRSFFSRSPVPLTFSGFDTHAFAPREYLRNHCAMLVATVHPGENFWLRTIAHNKGCGVSSSDSCDARINFFQRGCSAVLRLVLAKSSS